MLEPARMVYMSTTGGSHETDRRAPARRHLRPAAGARRRSGRTATFYIREAIERHLEDLEDLHAAEQAAAEHRETGGRTLSLDELDFYLGLED